MQGLYLLYNKNTMKKNLADYKRETLKMMLLRVGILPDIDYFISNEDVKFPKPNPEIFMKAMNRFGVSPRESLIMEASVYILKNLPIEGF